MYLPVTSACCLGLGITIEGGQGSWYNKIDVKSVVAKGAADEEGSLEVKDTIIKVYALHVLTIYSVS